MDGADFLQRMAQQIELLDTLANLLDQEKKYLATNQHDELLSIGQKKSDAFQKIQQLEQQKLSLVQPLLSTQDTRAAREQIRALLPESDQHRYDQLAQTLKERLTVCQQANTVNGQVIATTLHHNQRLIHILTGQNQDETYDTRGHMQYESPFATIEV